MLRGLYTSASGMLVQWNNQNVISNNLANSDTAGFKKDITTVQSFPIVPIRRIHDTYLTTKAGKIDLRPAIGYLGTGAMTDEVHTIYTEGRFKETGNKLDVAIKGRGFFTLQTKQGIRYTRDGAFAINYAGELTTLKGDLVLGQQGSIIIRGKEVVFAEDGGVYVDGTFIDNLRITDFPEITGLEKIGDNLFNAIPHTGVPFQALNFEIKQGYLELSNVNTVKEMVDMISAFRAYEANQRIITSQDSTLDKAINEVAKAV